MSPQPTTAPSEASAITFDVWGCRGSKSGVSSRIGIRTSCYSLHFGNELVVFDAGRGMAALGHAVFAEQRFAGIERIHVLVTHAHVDHWEGLKEADWMWAKSNRIALHIYAPREALETIRRGHEPPFFVPLEVLAIGTVAGISYRELAAGSKTELPFGTLEAIALHHYSGADPARRHLEALGYLVALTGGPTVAYLSDHEPVAATRAMEDATVSRAELAIVDAHFSDLADHAYGHGSQEYAAALARRHPSALVLASHHGPGSSDDRLEETYRRHGQGLANYQLAIEGRSLRWDPIHRTFFKSS